MQLLCAKMHSTVTANGREGDRVTTRAIAFMLEIKEAEVKVLNNKPYTVLAHLIFT